MHLFEKSGNWITLGALPYLMCPIERLQSLFKAGQLTFALNGAVFVKKQTRHGLLPIMLQELLDTRVMVKNAMKKHNGNQVKNYDFYIYLFFHYFRN